MRTVAGEGAGPEEKKMNAVLARCRPANEGQADSSSSSSTRPSKIKRGGIGIVCCQEDLRWVGVSLAISLTSLQRRFAGRCLHQGISG
eukprot:767951-Hanusia_phi.AAC.7